MKPKKLQGESEHTAEGEEEGGIFCQIQESGNEPSRFLLHGNWISSSGGYRRPANISSCQLKNC